MFLLSCKIEVDSNFLLVLKIKCKKFHQDRSKTVDLHTKYTNKQIDNKIASKRKTLQYRDRIPPPPSLSFRGQRGKAPSEPTGTIPTNQII
jgi:hypothetical protein